MKTPHVTVLTAARNASVFIGQTIACIRAQTFHDWEYIIVDDASADNTADVVKQAASQDNRIRLLRRNTQGGPFAAANSGLQEAQGKYIVRIDADDLSPRYRIEHQIAYLESHLQYRACITPWQSFNRDGVIPGGKTNLPIMSGGLKWYLALRGFSAHSSFAIEREAFLLMGGYKELPAAQDYRIMCELSRREWLGVMPEVLSFVRRHEHRLSGRSGNLQQQLAVDVQKEHLDNLTGILWSRETVDALWRVGQQRMMAISEGIPLLERWKSLWERDNNLDVDAKKELRYFFYYQAWKFLHANLRIQPVDVVRSATHSLGFTSAQSVQAGLDYLVSIFARRLNFGRTRIENLLCM